MLKTKIEIGFFLYFIVSLPCLAGESGITELAQSKNLFSDSVQFVKNGDPLLIDELRIGREVFNRNCLHCHNSEGMNTRSRSPLMRSYWDRLLSTKGVAAMTETVKKTHVGVEGISSHIFENEVSLRGAVRYLAIGGERFYLNEMDTIKENINKNNRFALETALAKLKLKNVVLWGGNQERYRDYVYMGKVYPFGQHLSQVVNDRLVKLFKSIEYIPSPRGEFEPLSDYEARMSDERKMHEIRYNREAKNKSQWVLDELSAWLNTMAGPPAIPVNFSYDADNEVFRFNVWETNYQEKRRLNIGAIQNKKVDNLEVIIPVHIEVARSYKRRLENEDVDMRPSVYVPYVYNRKSQTLTAQGVMILWRDSNTVEYIQNISGSMQTIPLNIPAAKKSNLN